MKKHLVTLVLLIATVMLVKSQAADPLVSTCISTAGPNAKYLKDFRVQLGKAASEGEFRYKSQMSLWKNTKYRFTMCNSEGSEGKLILAIKDETNKPVLSSYDQKTGKTYPYVDFICNRSGIYQISFDFTGGRPGSGVGVVSMVR